MNGLTFTIIILLSYWVIVLKTKISKKEAQLNQWRNTAMQLNERKK